MNTRITALLAAGLLLAGCTKRAEEPKAGPAGEPAPAPTNRVDVPPTVRRNLGITFARVESRDVARTVRFPGSFELLPQARRDYAAVVEGRVELLVKRFDRVETGAVLYRIDSPEWRELQGQIADAEQAATLAAAQAETLPPLARAHEERAAAVRANVENWEGRVAQLEQVREAGGGQAQALAEARASLTQSRSDLAEVLQQRAELEARRVEVEASLRAAQTRFDLLLTSAAALLRVPAEELRGAQEGAPAPWRSVGAVEVRAQAPGVVESVGVTNGAWAESSTPVVSTIEPDRLQFRARGRQADLGRLRNGLATRVVPPLGGSVEGSEPMAGELVVGLSADPHERTVELLTVPERVTAWARPGVSAFLEIVLEGGTEELAIPVASVTRDDLRSVFFRRDPKDPDKVIRMEADLGVSDGRWVVVNSGVREGDEVVVDGVYQLMLAGSGKAKAGHFHSDGTFHEGDHD